MSDYRKVRIDWLLSLFSEGYIAVLDGDKQELTNAVFEHEQAA